MIVKVYINNTQLDLFSNDSIPMQSSVLSSQDITKNQTEFTKSFSVPASDKNNNIFKHYYDANIDNAFDARTKVKGHIEIDGLPFKRGNFALRKVVKKNGRPSSYNINFDGEGTDLKVAIGNDYLSDLDLSAYNHLYNSDNVKIGLQDGLFDEDIVYNLLVKKAYSYDSSAAADNNIAYRNASQSHGVMWNDVRASIRLKSILDAIQSKYEFTFSNDFFERSEFTNLYLWLNNGIDSDGAGGATQIVDFNGGDSDFVNFTTNIGTYPTFNNSITEDWWGLKFRVIPEVGFEDTPYILSTYVDNEIYSSEPLVGDQTRGFDLSVNTGSQTFKVYYEVQTTETFEFHTRFEQKKYEVLVLGTNVTTFLTTGSTQTFVATLNPSFNMPKIKTMDFLRGIFQMFKLVVVPNGANSFYVNDVNSYYAAGKLVNLTKHIDFETETVSRGDILDDIKYNFEDAQSILNVKFTNNTGLGYGDEELLLTGEDNESLDGGSLEVSLPFEQVIYDRLKDVADNETTNVMYGAIIDEDLEPINIEPHIFYNVNVNTNSKTVALLNDSGGVEQITRLNTPSHTIDFEAMPFSTVFSSEFSNWNYTLISNTLFTNYHSEYISSLFNLKRRNFEFNAVLPTDVILKLNLNDVIKIQENYYRIDNFSLNLIDGKTKLNLINSFDNNLQGFGATQTTIISGYKASQHAINFLGSEEVDVVKIDSGFGVDWFTASKTDNIITIDLDENGLDRRTGVVSIQNKDKTKQSYIYITQKGNDYINWSRNDIDFSNNTIKF